MFCCKLKKKTIVTYQMLVQEFGGEVSTKSRISEWFEHYKEGRKSVGKDRHSGRYSTDITLENLIRVAEIIVLFDQIVKSLSYLIILKRPRE